MSDLQALPSELIARARVLMNQRDHVVDTKPWRWVWGASDLVADGGWHLVHAASAWKRHVRPQPLTPRQIVLGRSHMCAFMRYVDPLYVRMWASDLVADRITQLCRRMRGLTGAGTLGYLELRAPPQHFKTYLGCEYGPAFAGLQDPYARIVAMCYSRGLSKRNIRTFSEIVGRETYKAMSRLRVGRSVFLTEAGDETSVRDEARAEMVRFMVDHGWTVAPGPGYYLSVSLNSELTGWGFEWGIGDDLVRGPAEAYSGTMRAQTLARVQSMFFTRRQARTVFMTSMTPWHIDDVGYSMGRLAREAGIDVEALELPAIAKAGVPLHPDDPREAGSGTVLDTVRHDVQFYLQMEKLLGVFFAPLCQLQPIEFGQELIPPSAWSTFNPETLRTNGVHVIRMIVSVDTNGGGATVDGSPSTTHTETFAGVALSGAQRSFAHISLWLNVVMEGKRYLWKVMTDAGQWDPATLNNRVRAMLIRTLRAKEPSLMFIEGKALGPAVLSFLALERGSIIREVEKSLPNKHAARGKGWHTEVCTPNRDKRLRCDECQPAILAGLVQIPSAPLAKAGDSLGVRVDTNWVAHHRASWAVCPGGPPGASDERDADSQVIRHAIEAKWIDPPPIDI